jgi:hypothetical protein
LEINTMISPKLAVLMTTLALVGAAGMSPLAAFATSDNHDDDPDNSVSVERNNVLKQSNDVDQYACTNEQDNEANNDDGDDDQVAAAIGGDQSNDCVAIQAVEATNDGAIVDTSTNDIAAILANINVDDSILAGLGL